jgi:hypothetical protein
VTVDPSALARAEAQQVDAEGADSELAPQQLEALLAIGVERHDRYAVLHVARSRLGHASSVRSRHECTTHCMPG